MIYHNLNEQNLSRIVFGGASIAGEGGGYGFGEMSESDATSLLSYAYSKGINFFDTAPIYGFGTSEIRMGKAFKGIREKVFICSKAGVDWHDNMRVNMTNDPKSVARMFDESRKRLDSDYIDLYMIHWPDKRVDIRKSLEPILKQKLLGNIKHIGLCNTTLTDLEKTSEVDFLQAEYNHFQNAFEGLELESKLTMGWGTLDKGILSGKVKADTKFDDNDCRSWAPWWKKSDWKQRTVIAEELAKKIAPQSLLEYSIQKSLENCDFSMIGMKSSRHIDSAIAAIS